MPEIAAHGQPDGAAAAWKLRGEQQPANVHQSSMMHRPSLKVTCHLEMMSMPNSTSHPSKEVGICVATTSCAGTSAVAERPRRTRTRTQNRSAQRSVPSATVNRVSPTTSGLTWFTTRVEMAVIFVPVSKIARKPRSGPSRPLGAIATFSLTRPSATRTSNVGNVRKSGKSEREDAEAQRLCAYRHNREVPGAVAFEAILASDVRVVVDAD